MKVSRVIVRDVVKQFGARMALCGVCAEFTAAQVTLVQGANGSGKTTLLRILGTVLRPTAGWVAYEPLGRDVHTIRSELGWVSHDVPGYLDLTGRQNIELAARLRGLDPLSAWQRAAEEFKLGRFAERPVRTNSSGQRQRVALARALVHQPSVVLLDEPTTGLDAAGTEALVGVVDALVADRAVVVVVSHGRGPLEDRASMHVLLDRGRVVR